jgi:hypothetical protein
MIVLPGHPCDTPERPEAEQLAYFEQVFARTLQAIERAGPIGHHYALAGAVIRIVFAGPVLERLFTAAIAHLCIAAWDGRADATFHVWDSDSTGVEMAPPPCARCCFTARGDIWGMGSEQVRIAFHWSEYAVALGRIATGDFVHWVQGAGSVPYWARASPLRTLFHWLMLSRGSQLLHAAAVATDAGAVLLTGAGGIGKSTTALACLAAGLRYIGDDYVVVTLDPSPRAISLYATAKLNADQLARFPQFDRLVTNRAALATEKAVVLLYPDQARHVCVAAPLRALVTPVFAGSPATGFAPIAPGRLHAAAAFTTISQLPHAGRQTDDFIRRLIAAVPGYAIRLGTDLAALPRAIAHVIRGPHPLVEPRPAAKLPPVSVIIPVHNRAGFLACAVDSILRQHYPSIEIMVADDGSTDDLPAAIAALPVPVRHLRQRDRSGPAAARNRGIRAAAGGFLAFLDVDDLLAPDMLTTLMQEMQGAGAASPDVVGGHAQLFRRDADGAIRFIGSPEESYRTHIGAALYRREVFSTVGPFDEDLMFSEDTDWYNRAAERGVAVVRLAFVALWVQRHGGNMTRARTLDMHAMRFLKKQLDRRLARSGQRS